MINEIGLLDTNFRHENFCYKDLGLRVCQAGWKNVLCHNSYISYLGTEKKEDFSVKEKPGFIEDKTASLSNNKISDSGSAASIP